MRTAQIIRRFAFSEWGSTESVVWNIARTLQKNGDPAEIFSTDALSRVKDEVHTSVPIHRLPYRYPVFPLSKDKARLLDRKGGNPVVPGLVKAIRKGEFDLIHCHSLGRMATAARTAANQLRVPCIMTMQGGYFDPPPPPEIQKKYQPLKGSFCYGDFFDRLRGRTTDPFKVSNGIVCTSETDLARSKEVYPGKPVVRIPNGVDYDAFHEYSGTDFRKQVGIRMDRKILLCLSPIDHRKNQLVLPEVLALLGEPWHLVFIGSPVEDWYVEKLREKIHLMSLSGRVTMINGVPPDSSLIFAAYHAASAFLLPSLHESFGSVVLEAWSAGVPMIAAPTGGLKTLIRDGETGFFAPAEGAPEEWAEIVRKLDADPDLRGRVIEEGDREVRANYTSEISTAKLKEFYEEVQRLSKRR